MRDLFADLCERSAVLLPRSRFPDRHNVTRVMCAHAKLPRPIPHHHVYVIVSGGLRLFSLSMTRRPPPPPYPAESFRNRSEYLSKINTAILDRKRYSNPKSNNRFSFGRSQHWLISVTRTCARAHAHVHVQLALALRSVEFRRIPSSR